MYIKEKILSGNSVIALDKNNFAGFCYIEVWEHGKYVAHSGLIVSPKYRNMGIGKKIKKRVLELSLKKYPKSKIFGITTGMPVMKINYELGYRPAHFNELTEDPEFWKGCKTCQNYDILKRTELNRVIFCFAIFYFWCWFTCFCTFYISISFNDRIQVPILFSNFI